MNTKSHQYGMYQLVLFKADPTPLKEAKVKALMCALMVGGVEEKLFNILVEQFMAGFVDPATALQAGQSQGLIAGSLQDLEDLILIYGPRQEELIIAPTPEIYNGAITFHGYFKENFIRDFFLGCWHPEGSGSEWQHAWYLFKTS